MCMESFLLHTQIQIQLISSPLLSYLFFFFPPSLYISHHHCYTVRAENAVLQEKVKHLSFRVKELTIENESLKAEVEMYRNEFGGGSNSSKTGGGGATTDGFNEEKEEIIECDDFIRSGNGIYPQISDITLPNLHETTNPLCCTLSGDDTILATGGADCYVSLCAWGSAGSSNDTEAAKKVVESACRVRCDGPVIATAFHPKQKLVAAGCMDGNVYIISYEIRTGTGLVIKATTKIPTKHGKYVKNVVWSTKNNTNNLLQLASASADGTVQIHQISVKTDYTTEDEQQTIELNTVETFHLQGAIESIVFIQDGIELCCYARGKPYLIIFDTSTKDYQQRKINLNHGGKPPPPGTKLEDQHVSFAVMDMTLSPSGKYLALATDTSRNIIMEVQSGLHVRNLHGHQNDGYSNPKIAWSQNEQYLLGNTQEDGTICVWDIASTQIIKRLDGHGQTIRDMFASTCTDTLVTTSFDKQTKLWFGPSS